LGEIFFWLWHMTEELVVIVQYIEGPAPVVQKIEDLT
jgi:hypothetical protein